MVHPGVLWRKNLGNQACNKRKSIHRKGVVHGFGKAFTFRLYIDLSGNSKVSRKRPFLANQEAKAGAKPAHRARNPLLVRLADAVLALYEDADAV
ncbi:hypothetical protein OROMI_034082 [Orobanche minor]